MKLKIEVNCTNFQFSTQNKPCTAVCVQKIFTTAKPEKKKVANNKSHTQFTLNHFKSV